jgi:hypothetical protein
VRRSTTVRGGIAAAVILVLGLGGLAACTGNTPPAPTGSPSASATADPAADAAALAAQVKERLAPGDVVLVKGSRANRLERLVAALGSTPSQPGDAR